MSQLNVDNIRNRTGTNGGPNFPSGITIAVGQTAYIHGNLQVDGTETIVNTETLNVADKTVGIGSTTNPSNTTADGAGIIVFGGADGNKSITWSNSDTNWTLGGGGLSATNAVVGSAVTINSSGIKAGIVTANTVSSGGSITAANFYGSGENLEGVVSGIELEAAGTKVNPGVAATTINFQSGATITSTSNGISTVTIAAGISTAQQLGVNGVVTLDLSKDHHNITLNAGVTTFTCSGGAFGGSYSVVVTQPASGVTTVGFSTYFLWPSGSAPVLSKTSAASEIDLISFVLKRPGASGIATQLLASAGLNYQ